MIHNNTSTNKLLNKTLLAISINVAIFSGNVFADDTIQKDASQADAPKLEVIVITAEKMDKNIKDTTTAITVIDGEAAARMGAKTINDVITKAPNVVDGGFGTVNIRGVNGSGSAYGYYATISGSRPRINTSVDGVADAYTGYNFIGSGVWDVEQVEILRGPQSTTQGENSIGGAVSVKTNDPTFAPEYAIRGGLETYDNGNVMKNVAVMASGPLNDELAYRITAEGTDGDGYISYKGETGDMPVDPEASDNINLRAKLLWEPAFNEDLSIKLTTNYRKADGSYVNWVDWSDGEVSEDQTMTLSSVNSTNARIQDSDVKNISTEVNYAINSAVSSVTILSINDQKNKWDQYPTSSTYTYKDKTISAESRLLFTPADSPLNGFVGIMVADRENTIYSPTASVDGKTEETRAGLFGEANYDLTEQLTLTLGGRLQYEDQSRTYIKSGTSYIDDDLDELLFLPKLAATYDVTGNTTLGLSARKGYNSGGMGYNSITSEVYDFDSETVYAYEFSSKTAFANGSSINTAIFFNNYQDYQAVSDRQISNVDGAYTYGLEIEATHWLTNSLQVSPAIGLLRSDINKDANYKGNELSGAPELNASLALTQYIGENLTIGADVTYVGENYSDLSNTEDYKAGDYTLLNTAIDYKIGDMLISAYVTNLTNEDVIYVINSGKRAAIGQSRTFGLNVTYRM